MRIFAAPIRTLDEDGRWVDIDPTLVSDGDGVHPRVAGADVFFSDGGVGEEMASLETDAGRIAFVWPGRLREPELVGNVATYRDVYPGVDLELEAFPNGYAKRFVVRERPSSALVLSFPVELKRSGFDGDPVVM